MHNHNHSICTHLAGEHTIGTADSLSLKKSQNILIFARKSDFLHDVMEAIKETILYLSANQGRNGIQKVRSIYLEGWAL